MSYDSFERIPDKQNRGLIELFDVIQSFSCGLRGADINGFKHIFTCGKSVTFNRNGHTAVERNRLAIKTCVKR